MNLVPVGTQLHQCGNGKKICYLHFVFLYLQDFATRSLEIAEQTPGFVDMWQQGLQVGIII